MGLGELGVGHTDSATRLLPRLYTDTTATLLTIIRGR